MTEFSFIQIAQVLLSIILRATVHNVKDKIGIQRRVSRESAGQCNGYGFSAITFVVILAYLQTLSGT